MKIRTYQRTTSSKAVTTHKSPRFVARDAMVRMREREPDAVAERERNMALATREGLIAAGIIKPREVQ